MLQYRRPQRRRVAVAGAEGGDARSQRAAGKAGRRRGRPSAAGAGGRHGTRRRAGRVRRHAAGEREEESVKRVGVDRRVNRSDAPRDLVRSVELPQVQPRGGQHVQRFTAVAGRQKRGEVDQEEA